MSDRNPRDDHPTASLQSRGDSTAMPATMPTSPRSLGEGPGDQIGPFQLLEVIGEGGFGVVFRAQRLEPMVQLVALKIIKPGMDSKAVVARFEQERQALAVMDHPNVARVLDGGVTPAGRPYFVMEYVKGEPITAFADRHRLTINQRLELFIPVCEAVQHAHMKGIIHRDLKPSNVLVEMVDGKPVVKVIDFGIAKATDASAVQHSVFSIEGLFIGTPEYMSPEQASGQADIDTRTDVYALGVTLYELLAGVQPFDPVALRRRGIDEIMRIIREEEPPRPSTRLSTVKDQSDHIASARRESHLAICRILRRELEWIPLKAMRKDRDRRYESAAALGDDIRRYLEGRALRAAPESRAYLARKFVRRNRVLVMAASAVFLALSAGLAGTVWQAREAERQRDAAVEAGRKESLQREEAERQRTRADERADAATRAEAAATAARDAEKERAEQLKKVADFQSQMVGTIDTRAAGEGLMADVRARFAAALEKDGVPEDQRAAQARTLADLLARVNATDTAAAMIDRTILKPAIKAIDEQFKGDPKTDASLRQALASTYYSIGLYKDAFAVQESALATRRRVLGEDHPDTILALVNMGPMLRAQGKLAEAEPYYREALEKARRVLGEDHVETLNAVNSMGVLLRSQGRLAEAEPLMRESLDKSRRILGEDHPRTLVAINNMGATYLAMGRFPDAEGYFREAVDKRRRVLGDDHPDTIAAISNLGFVLRDQGKLGEAEACMREALERFRRVLGEDHPNTAFALGNMGFVLQAQGKLAEAEPYMRESLEKFRRTVGDDHPDAIGAINSLGMLLLVRGDPDQAEPFVREALDRRRRVLGKDHPGTLISVNNMGLLFQAQGNLADAESSFRDAMTARRRVLGEAHIHTLDTTVNLGSVLRRQAKHQEAIDLLVPIEPAARKLFIGGNARRLADLLTALGRARVGLGFDAERFTLAESNLLEAHVIYLAARDRGPTHKDTLACAQGAVDLYAAWDAAEPGKGFDAKAQQWRTKLGAEDNPVPGGK